MVDHFCPLLVGTMLGKRNVHYYGVVCCCWLPFLSSIGLVAVAVESSTCPSSSNSTIIMSTAKKYVQDGDEAREIAKYLPYFPFKGIPRFYDIGGFLYEPAVFQKIVDIFAERYREIGIDVIAG